MTDATFNVTSAVEIAVSSAISSATDLLESSTGIKLNYGPTLTELFYEIQPQLEDGKTQIILSKKYSHKAVKKVLTGLGYRPTTKKPELVFKVEKIRRKKIT